MERPNLDGGVDRAGGDSPVVADAMVTVLSFQQENLMNCRMFLVLAALFAAGISPAVAGKVYEVTSTSGDETVRYEVRFGGGKVMDQFTAFDPASKQFVYLEWKRDGEPPVPIAVIWDHRTGESIPLYAFPDVEHPLPVIPSIEAMKVCPITGDADFEARLHIIID